MRISDWSSDVCSSDLQPEIGLRRGIARRAHGGRAARWPAVHRLLRAPGELRAHADRRLQPRPQPHRRLAPGEQSPHPAHPRSEEHTSELQSLMRISYAVFCLKKKKKTKHYQRDT